MGTILLLILALCRHFESSSSAASAALGLEETASDAPLDPQTVPIKARVSRLDDGTIEITMIMCRLDRQDYAGEPYLYPMFKDRARHSSCKVRTTASDEEIKCVIHPALFLIRCLRHIFRSMQENFWVESIVIDERQEVTSDSSCQEDEATACLLPTGFIFHMGRCGSTLMANALASIPSNVVFRCVR